MGTFQCEIEKWRTTHDASMRGRRIERQISNLASDIEGQIGDDPQHFYVLGEAADEKQKEALRIVLERLNSILL